MKILSIGFKNPFHKSGYTNTIEINNLENINVFIGKNNSGKTNVLRSIYKALFLSIVVTSPFSTRRLLLTNFWGF
ncbi:hypothetical protein LCGC14_1449020 [marine sediment metagenome]|uniref:AAA domain-containing protein n=1 Tax=marine sediment metagenome TaxID=412755 RepID=A0A0F9K4N4_9ZZZZ